MEINYVKVKIDDKQNSKIMLSDDKDEKFNYIISYYNKLTQKCIRLDMSTQEVLSSGNCARD